MNTGNKADAGFVCDNSDSTVTLLRGVISLMLCAQQLHTNLAVLIVCVPIFSQQRSRVTIDRHMVPLKRSWMYSMSSSQYALRLWECVVLHLVLLKSYTDTACPCPTSFPLLSFPSHSDYSSVRCTEAYRNHGSHVRVHTISNFYSQIAQW